jgi:Tol biopolymer transport system component/DNA-binding winged helix-turn-helix (wHTH) protein
MQAWPQKIYRFDEFELDVPQRQLLHDGQPVPLMSKSFELLLVLVEHRGRILDKDELYQLVWPDQVVEESNLTVHMSAIRKALGERANRPRYITTISGQGYRFAADLHELEDPTNEMVVESHTLARIVIEEEETSDAEVRGHGDTENSGARHWVVGGQSEPVAVAGGFDLSGNGVAILTGKGLLETEPKSFRLSRAVYFLAGGLILALLVAGGVLLWHYTSQPKKQDRPTAMPFVQASITQLTTKGNVANAVLSPDGRFYAYTLNERSEYKSSLWLGQADGSRDIQLRPPGDNLVRGLAFWPGGKMLYFSLGGGEESPGGFFKMPVLGGVAEKLLDNVGAYFTVSPDGKQIAFFRSNREKGSSALVVAHLDGTGEREVVTRPLDKHFYSIAPAWSPDGSLIAVGAVDDNVKQSEEIFTVRVADGQTEQLTALKWIRIHNLVWARDGQGLIAVAVDKNEALRHLWGIEFPSGRAVRLSRDTDSYGSALSISADGHSLVAVHYRRESNIWIAPAGDLSEAQQVTFSSINGIYGWYGLDWTPDNRIVFMAGIDRTLAICSMDADGGNIRQLTSKGFFDQRPSVTADGRFILFHSNRSGTTEIWRVNSDGSDLRQLTTGGGNTYPHPTPDGKWVVYTSTRDGKSFVWRVPLEGGTPVRVTEKDSSDPRVSHDGKFIACGYRADGNTPLQLAIISIPDGKPVKLFDISRNATFNQGIRWTPDDKAVCYRDWANGIWRQDLNGGPPQRLKGLPEEKLYNFGWSADGKLFAFTRGREIGDAVLIRDFR